MKRPTFNIAALPALKRTYKELLRAEFDESALSDCLALFRHLVDTSGYSITFEWETPKPRRRKAPYPIPGAATDYLQTFLEQANAGIDTEVPDQLPDQTSLERQTWVTGVFLTFQSRVRLEGDTGFARDVQSLLYQLCLQVLSPKLLNKGLYDANAFLLHALFAHVQIAWTDRPEHQTYLLGTLYEHTGQQEEAMAQLRASVNNSSVDDHDFLTKAQTYWSLLVERGRIEEAKSFVLQTYRRASDRNLPELEEMLNDTYAFEGSKRKAS